MTKTRHNSFTKKAVSLALTLVMAFSYVGLLSGVFGADLFGTKQVAEAANVKAASVTSGDLTFVVPEAIYLYPDAKSSRYSVSTPFQYYINNDQNGNVIANNCDTTGKIYYSFSGASSATISYSFLNTSLNAISGGSINLSSTNISSNGSVNITGGMSPSLDNTTTGCYIRWTLSFKDSADNLDKKAYAYTYVYKPYTVPVAAGADGATGTSGGANWAGHITWISGFHFLTEGTKNSKGDWDEDYWRYTNLTNFSAFISKNATGYVGGTATTGSNSRTIGSKAYTTFASDATTWYTVFSNSSGNGYYLQIPDDSNPSYCASDSSSTSTAPVHNFMAGKYRANTKNIQGCIFNNTYGNIYIDTSRYSSNLKDVPNLAVGMLVCDNEEVKSGDSGNWSTWYVADYTDRTPNGYNTWHKDADNRSTYYNDKGTLIASQGSSATETDFYNDEGVRYAGAWPRTLLGNTTTQGASYDYRVKGFYGNEDGEYYASSHCVVQLHAIYYQKGNLRSAVLNAIKKMPALGVTGISGSNLTSCYFDTNNDYKWNAFQTAFTNAYKALILVDGSVTNPDTLASALNEAVSNLCTKVTFNAGTGKGTITANSGKTNPTYIKIGSNQTISVKPSDYVTVTPNTGYSFEGWSTDPNATSGTTSNSSVTLGYNQTLYALWKIIPGKYTLIYNEKLSTDGESTKVENVDYDIENPFNIPSLASDVKPGYVHTGKWKVTSTGGNWPSLSANPSALLFDGGTTSAGYYGNVTLTAQYTPIDYVLTFDPNGGTEVQQVGNTHPNMVNYTVESNEALPVSTKLGYKLSWVPTTSDGFWQANEKYDPGTALFEKYGSVHMVADWEPCESKVYLNLGSGATIPGGVTQYDYSFATGANIPNKAVKDGYEFAGWKVTGAPTDAQYNAAVSQTVDGIQGFGNPPVGNRWVINTVYVPESDGSTILPTDKFGDVTLSPVFNPINYKIIFNGNGGTTPDPVDPYTIESNAFHLQESVRPGYTFSGWQVSTPVGNWSGIYQPSDSISGMWGNVTLNAQWTTTPYTVTLNVNGGEALDANTLIYKTDDSLTLPHPNSTGKPVRTGYEFKGWKVTAPGADTNWVADTVYQNNIPSGFYGNLTLTAQWEHKTYTIDKSTNGTNGEDKTYHIDDAAFTLGGSVLAGYEFTGWKVTSAEADCWTIGDVIGANDSISGKYGNVTVVALFSPIGYHITYQDKDGAQIGEAQAYNIESDDVMIRTYAKDGYSFDGWEVISDASAPNWANGSVLQPGGPLAANIYYGDVILKARLTPIDYTVTFDANGGLPLASLPYNIESAGETDVLPTPTRNGYDFNGWKVTTAAGNWAANATFAAGDAVTGQWGSPTLQAQWTPKKFTITYITGNYPDGLTKQGTFNETAPDLTDAEKGKPADAQYTYTFDHWDPALTTVTGEATYTAVYTTTINKYTVTWKIPVDVNGELNGYTDTLTPNVPYGTTPEYGGSPTIQSADPDEYKWEFKGWTATEGGELLTELSPVTGNVTYYAVFEKQMNPEDVVWHVGTKDYPDTCGVGNTPQFKLGTPTVPDEDGYKFIFTHWDPTPEPVVHHDGEYIYEFTAQFDRVKQDYTVTLALNGGETEAPLSYGYQVGDTVTLPLPTRTGYTFAGWLYTPAQEQDGNWEADTLVLPNALNYAVGTHWGNVTLTAQWTPIEYTIRFNASGDNNELPAAMTYTIESTNAIPAATREGYVLNGWIVSVGSGNWTQGATLPAAYTLLNNYGDITLTPVWQVRTYTITWVSDGYTQTSEAEYGSAIMAYTPIAKMGYTAEWDNEVPATMPASDLTFTAVYTPVQYYIRLNVNGGSAMENFYYTIDGNNTLPTPTRDGATFTGWKVASAQGNWVRNAVMAGGASLNGKYGNVSLTAQWDLERHTVTWVAGDVTRETVWLYGAVPSYDGTPYKSPDESNSYVFVGWAASPDGDTLEALPTVTADVTYYAQFSKTERKYAVVWYIDGATTTEYYSYGATPVYPGENDPTRPSTSEYDFTFTGWNPAVSEVTADVTYYAQFDVFTKLQGLSIDVSSLVLDIGEGGKVQAQIYPSTATVKDVVWTSLNTDVATVNDTGEITAVSNGVALINVASVDRSFNAYCVVTVKPRHTSYLEITAGGVSTTQLAGAMVQLSATLQPDNATDTGIRWSSGDISVATVDQNGLVKYVGVGETDIVAVASDGFSLGSIHVVTTTDETEVEDTVKTYRVTFGENNMGYLMTEDGEVFHSGYLNVAEGESVRFKLAVDDDYQTRYSVYVNLSRVRYGSDFWYELEDVHENAVISVKNGDGGSLPQEQQDDGNNNGTKLSFFERLGQFLRKIVEFFRNLFKK